MTVEPGFPNNKGEYTVKGVSRLVAMDVESPFAFAEVLKVTKSPSCLYDVTETRTIPKMINLAAGVI